MSHLIKSDMLGGLSISKGVEEKGSPTSDPSRGAKVVVEKIDFMTLNFNINDEWMINID